MGESPRTRGKTLKQGRSINIVRLGAAQSSKKHRNDGRKKKGMEALGRAAPETCSGEFAGKSCA